MSLMSPSNQLVVVYLLNFIISNIIAIFFQNKFDLGIDYLFIFIVVFASFIYLVSFITENTSFIDLFWGSQGIFLIFIKLFIFSFSIDISKNKLNTRYELMISIVVLSLYSLKHIVYYLKNFESIKQEDFRYKEFKKNIPNRFKFQLFNYFSLHLIPSILEYLGFYPTLQTLDFLLKNSLDADFNPYTSWAGRLIYIYGIVLSYGGILLEILADEQLADFREKKKNNNYSIDKQVMRYGIWKYSRHPNYLGELLFFIGMWVSNLSFNTYSIFNTSGMISIILLFKLYSIPNMEQNLLNKYKDEYKKYQSQVPELLPFINRFDKEIQKKK